MRRHFLRTPFERRFVVNLLVWSYGDFPGAGEYIAGEILCHVLKIPMVTVMMCKTGFSVLPYRHRYPARGFEVDLLSRGVPYTLIIGHLRV